MNAVSMQIQTVLYKNTKQSLMGSLDSVESAVCLSRLEGLVGRVFVKYGDASPEPIFSDEEVLSIRAKYSAYFEFDYVFFHENTGTSKGHNRLAKGSTADYLLLMNPDIVLSPSFFRWMLPVFEDDSVGLVEGRQTPVPHPKDYDRKTGDTSWGSGAVTMMRTQLYGELGGYDEKTFFMYCDDVDLSWRVRLAGKRVVHQPKAVVYHAKRLSERGGWIPTAAEEYYSAEAALLMAYKWSNVKVLHRLVAACSSGTEMQRKALEAFRERQESGEMPARLDPEHKVAQFIDGNYAHHRYGL